MLELTEYGKDTLKKILGSAGADSPFQLVHGQLTMQYDSLDIKTKPVAVEFIFKNQKIARLLTGHSELVPNDTLHIKHLTGSMNIDINF
jgi:hypothetical protein